MKLNDKVIIVTGSTTGIGEAIAHRCVSEGAYVVVHGRDETRGRAVVADIGSRAVFHCQEIAEPNAPQRIVHAAIETFGKLDGLVNNAAWVVRSDLSTTSADFFDRVFAVNVRAPLMLMQAAVPHLKRTKGSVVNIGSATAYTGGKRQLDYAMSKGALVTMSRNLADMLAPDCVRVNHFNVGWVITPNEYKLKMTEGMSEGWPDHPPALDVPTGQMTQPQHIAAHVVFWLSDESKPISGSVIDLEQFPVVGRMPLRNPD